MFFFSKQLSRPWKGRSQAFFFGPPERRGRFLPDPLTRSDATLCSTHCNCHLQCLDTRSHPISVWFFLLVGSDVWNVWYSSAHYTMESRRCTCFSNTPILFTVAVVFNHVSLCVKQLFHSAPLHALRSRMSTCRWHRAMEPLYCSARYSFSVFFWVVIFGV